MSARKRPNLVLVMTDDQGYGDLRCTGNPWIQTPNLDEFYVQSTRLPDFHVSPLCTPTRGAIMSGRNPLRNGAWATCWGRSILRRDETTMADVFSHNGYATGMFGKWHLGDNYPYRPQDRGFEKVVAHKGGGVGQTPDFWGNSYFDDTYFHNSVPVAHEGYCTDIWLDEAMSFIEGCGDEPFFCYLATNAPHGPYLVADEYADLYRGNPEIPEPNFYGMITNIDENFARLRAFLNARGIEDDTILIFMTDNGSSGGFVPNTGAGYNAGMRGKKASYYDGGHRVPFFIRWPGGGIVAGDVRELIVHLDLLPTFCELCDLSVPDHRPWDGLSVAPLLLGRPMSLPDREVFLQYRQNTEPPDMWTNGVMTRDWRLINGEELYYMPADPGQCNNLADRYPDMLRRLRLAHERWWDEVSPGLEEYCPISIGADEENPTCLGAMDVLGDVAWNQTHIRQAMKSTGRWAVQVERAGRYELRLRRWPRELGLPIDAVLQEESVAIHPTRARVKIGEIEQTAEVSPGADEVSFTLDLQAGRADLEAWFADESGDERGAYYVYVERK